MGTHLIPRSNVKGQDRFFIIFSIPGLIGTIIALIPGYLVYNLFKMSNPEALSIPGIIALIIFGAIGFVIGQVQFPDNGSLPILKKVGGLYIRDVIKSYFIFKKTKKKFAIQVSEDQVFAESTSKTEDFLMGKIKKDKD